MKANIEIYAKELIERYRQGHQGANSDMLRINL
jgi:hypothetical protein